MYKSFSIVNLGCKVNSAESDSICASLLSLGLIDVSVEKADFVIVNTCAVTSMAEKKTRKTIRGVLSNNPTAKVIVTGCASVMNPGELSALSKRVVIVSKAKLEQSIQDAVKEGPVHALSDTCMKSHFHSRRNLKIQDGCDRACTYCIVYKLRGPLKSMPAKTVLNEALKIESEGAGEIVLSGIDLGRWSDFDTTLSDLVKTLSHTLTTSRLRLSSIELSGIDEQLLHAIATSNGKVCKHLHIPLQSGSSKVLREMGRTYTANDYISVVENIREVLPDVSLTTDIIVGFPGETEEDFNATLEVSKLCSFSKIHVFPYSKRKGTPAALRSDQLSDSLKSARAKTLRELASSLRQQDLKNRAGTREVACVIKGNKCITESYHEIKAPDDVLPGSLIDIML